ncbi:DUF2934 domain-containing protein [Mesorhizobium sp. M7A.F.Ca.US.008.03.1.1]|uniref:DUF2934 domain-containing protein n=1 Tax=Mesorhizobium sp. M7A.F.Ca.US.008.03.1.1 TaxID=2496742 RepID=UPI001FE001C3|nr:DUF2934 domain-containing protein [Mesorhizobium sp. M7A.F.Ca.US.008.03.1.1]
MALADGLIHKTAGIGVSRKNIGTEITKRLIHAIHKAFPKSRLRQRLLPTEEEQKKGPGIETDGLEDLAMDSREEKIKRRAHEIWEQEGRPAGREQEHWDRAVQEIEAEGSETERGPVLPDPTVAADSNSLKR